MFIVFFMSWGFEKANPLQVRRDILHRILDQWCIPEELPHPFLALISAGDIFGS